MRPMRAPSSRAGSPAGRSKNGTPPTPKWKATSTPCASATRSCLGRLVIHVLKRAMRRAPQEPQRSRHRTGGRGNGPGGDRMVRAGAAGIARGHRPHALHPRPAGAAARRHAGQMAGPVPAPGPWPEEFVKRHARSLSARRPGFPARQDGAASARPRAHRHAHQLSQLPYRKMGCSSGSSSRCC